MGQVMEGEVGEENKGNGSQCPEGQYHHLEPTQSSGADEAGAYCPQT